MTVTSAPPATRWAAHIWVPAGRRGSHVDDVAQVSELMGAPLEEWQLEAVDALTAYGRGGVPLALEGAILACRQNGKTFGVARPIAVAECLFGPPSLSTWTAQLKETALDTFGELRDLMGRKADGTPYDEDAYRSELGDYVLGVSETDSAEALFFRNGAELAFRTRSNRAGRGRRPRRLYVDEALFFTIGQAAAIVPGMGRQGPTAGILYASSPALAESSYLHEIVRRGRAGDDPSLAYVEHCAPGGYDRPGCELPKCDHEPDRPGCRLDDEDYWRAGNPAYRTGSMSRAYLAGARRALRAAFAHEHLGWHERPIEAGASPVHVEAWRALTDQGSKPRGPVVFGVEVARSREVASVSVAGWRKDKAVHVGLVDRREGTDWVVDRVAQLVRKHDTIRLRWPLTGKNRKPRVGVVIDPTSPAGSLVPDLRAAGIEPVLMTTGDVATAAEWLQDAVRDGQVWHTGSVDVDDALKGSSRRDLGDGRWSFGRRRSAQEQGVEIDPIVAVTNAHWLLRSAPRPLSGRGFSSTFG